MPLDALGRRDPKVAQTRHGKAKRAEAQGCTFRSVLERDMTVVLWDRAKKHRPMPALVIREPKLDLFQLWTTGMGTPHRWKPDALWIAPRHVRAYEPSADAAEVAGFSGGGGWRESWLDLWEVEVHEAKSPRQLESRDYIVRLAAFRAAFPAIPVFVWRRVDGRLEREDLPALKPSSRYPETGS